MGVSGQSLLIESADSMIIYCGVHVTIYKTYHILTCTLYIAYFEVQGVSYADNNI